MSKQIDNFSVTVVIPLYNKAAHISRALDSVFQQSHQDLLFEIIVVNDGSTDGSDSIAQSYSESDERITIVNQNNQGLGAARNKGASVAKTTWLSFLDADDEWRHDFLLYFGEYIQQYPDMEMFGCGRLRITRSKSGKLSYTPDVYFMQNQYRGAHILDLNDHVFSTVSIGLPIGPSAFFVKRNAFFAVGGMPEKSRRNTDPAFWVKFLAERSGYLWMPVLGANIYRESENMLTKNVMPDLFMNPVRVTVKQISSAQSNKSLVCALYSYSDLYVIDGIIRRLMVGELDKTCVGSVFSFRLRMFFYIFSLMPRSFQILVAPFVTKLRAYAKKRSFNQYRIK